MHIFNCLRDIYPKALRIVLLSFTMTLITTPVFAGYIQHNLVSDISGLADYLDPNLVNPWGISSPPSGTFWIANNGTGTSTLYNSSGIPQALVVSLPSPNPTGQVFNANSSFFGDRFIFAAENGTISGWRSALTSSAALRVDNSASGAVYKGLTIDSNELFAANFSDGKIDVFSANYLPVVLGGFLDPSLPVGYAPFNIQNIGGKLFVAYAMQDSTGKNELAGAGKGYVDVYDTNGNLLQSLITGGALNSPWSFALAPSDFGDFSNDLLVGNFGDGRINAFDPTTGVFRGVLANGFGNPLVIDGLKGITFGNGGTGGAKNELYFTAGINNGTDGLFGSLSVVSVPEPTTLSMIIIGLVLVRSNTRRIA